MLLDKAILNNPQTKHFWTVVVPQQEAERMDKKAMRKAVSR